MGTRTGYAENAGLTNKSQGFRSSINHQPGTRILRIHDCASGNKRFQSAQLDSTRADPELPPIGATSDPTVPPSWVRQTIKTKAGPSHATSASTGHLSDITTSPNHLPSMSHSAKTPRPSVPSKSPAVSRGPAAVMTGLANHRTSNLHRQVISRHTPHPSPLPH